MKFPLIILSILLFFSQITVAQIETDEKNFLESKAVLSEIVKENTFRNGNVEFKFGYFQMTGDTRGDAVKLNSKNQVPYIQMDADYLFSRRFGVIGSYQLAQNYLNDSTENTTSSSQKILQFGIMYKHILDEENIKNYYHVKLQYFDLSNNFKLERPEAQFINGYNGFLIGLERVIPATEAFDIRGGLDIIVITSTETVTDPEFIGFQKDGNGLAFNLAGYYNLNRKSRFGLGLGVLAFFNSFNDKDDSGKNNYTQTYRNLYLTYNYLF